MSWAEVFDAQILLETLVVTVAAQAGVLDATEGPGARLGVAVLGDDRLGPASS